MLEKEINRISVQMRHVETIFLSKLKTSDDEPLTHINVLMNYTYGELVAAFERLMDLSAQIDRNGSRPLRALINLAHATLQLSGIKLPFDGTVLDGTDQVFYRLIMVKYFGSFFIPETWRTIIQPTEGRRVGGIYAKHYRNHHV